MPRRVAVVAELDASQYIAEARVMKAETSAADREMNQLDRSIDAVDRDMAELAVSSAVAARQVDNVGDQAGQSARALALLDARIKATRLSVRELGLQFAITGDQIDGRNLTRERSLLARLERLRKELDDVGGSTAAAAGGAAGSTTASAGEGFGRMSIRNPYVIAGALTVVSALGAPIGAMIGGIVAGAIGTVGVAGGLLSAAKDPRVINAAHTFGDKIADEFFRGGDSFVQPALQSMDILEKAFKDMKVPESLAKVSDDVTVIAGGIGRLGTALMPGFNRALDRMGPFADAAADGMETLGASLGDFMDSVTASPGAVMGLRLAFDVLGGTIVFLGNTIEFLSDAYAGLLILGAKAGQNPVIELLSFGLSKAPAESMQRWIDEFQRARDLVPAATAGVASFGATIDRTTELTNAFNNALNASYTAFLDFTGAEIGAEEAIDRLQEAIYENGVTLDVHTDKGREQLGMLKQLAEAAAEAARLKLIETGSVEEANAVYDTYRQQLYDTFIQAGMTAAKAQELTDKWLGLQTLQDIEKFVQINISARVRAYYEDTTSNPFLKGFAEGGETPAYEPFLVGEHGPELMYSSRRAFVANQSQAWNGAMGGLDYAQLGSAIAAALQDAPIESNTSIEIGGEVVRVVRSEQSAANRDLRRRVLAGAGG